MIDNRTRLLAVVTAQLGAIETPEADPIDAKCQRDLKFDSLDVVELVMAAEDEFQIVITDDEAESFQSDASLRDLLALVERKLAVTA